MRTIRVAQIVAMTVSAVVVGVLVEFSRSEQMQIPALLQLWGFALISYLLPTLLIMRATTLTKLTWLVPPILGTIILQLLVVSIPNAIALWKLPVRAPLLQELGSVLPGQLNHFAFFVVFYSGITYVIAGLAYGAALAFECRGISDRRQTAKKRYGF